MIFDAAEMDRAAGETSPRLDESFVDGVELIRVRPGLLQPEPLRHGCFDERGRRVSIVFKHLWRRDAVIGEIESAVETEIIAFPRIQNGRHGNRRNAKPRPPRFLDHRFGGLDAKCVKRIRCGFESVDVGGRKFVTSGFVPIRPGLMRVISQPNGFNLRAPIGSRFADVTFHHDHVER